MSKKYKQVDKVVHSRLNANVNQFPSVKSMTKHVQAVLLISQLPVSEEEVHRSMDKWCRPKDKYIRGGKIRSGRNFYIKNLRKHIERMSSIRLPSW